MTYEVKAEGIVQIDVLDAETLEVKHTYQEKNDINKNGAFYLSAGSFYKTSNSGQSWPYYAYINYGANYSNPTPYGLGTQLNSTINPVMYISEKKYVKPVFLDRYLDGAVAQSSSVIAGDFVSNNGNPDTLTFKRRFNAPTANRSIWVIALGSGQVTAGQDLMTFCALTSPCSQSTTEILDITYKIQFYWTLNTNSTTPGVAPTSDLYSVGMVYANTSKDYGRFSVKCNFMPNKLHKSKYQYRSWGIPMHDSYSSYPDTGDSYLASNWNLKGTTQTRWDISVGIGRLIQSVYHRPLDQQPYGNFAPFGSSNFLNKPIQPVHYHSSVSNVPFMDSSNPGSTMGTLSLNGASWTNSEKFPEYYKIAYHTSGGNNEAKYNFSYSPNTGFVGNTYSSLHYDLAYTERRTSKWQGYENTTLVGMHGSSRELPCNWEEYSDTKFVLFDDTGITISDIANGDAVTFDATTVPSLPVTKVAQVAVNFSNKDVWIACSNTGLYKIQDAFGTPVVTKISTINGTNINAAYAVSLGYNNSIVCAYEGGIAITNNNGSSWTTYNQNTTPAFSYAGVTDNNWSKIRTIRTDIQSSSNEMCIVYAPATGTTYSSCWWSTSTSAVAGPANLGSAVVLTNGVQPITKYWVVRCSHYGSMWVVGVNNQTVNDAVYLHIAKFGSATTVVNLNSENASNLGYTNFATPQNVNISFYYDYYKNPYVAVFRRIAMSSPNYYVIHAISIYNSRGVVVGTVRPHPLFSWTGWYGKLDVTPARMYFIGSLGFNASYHMQPFVHIAAAQTTGAWPYETNSFVKVITPQDTYDTCPGFPVDSYNGRYTPFEEFVWKKFHWNNGTNSWQQNYYAPAIDSSPYLQHAARHNFDTESHSFTGRSLIDVTNTFKLAQSTGSSATFAFTVNSKAKLTSKLHELSSTLLSIESESQTFRIVWTGGTNFEIHTGTTPTVTNVSAALANDTTYRIVVTVSGTNCTVYSNGASIASVTLPTALNLSDVTRAYIGAQVFNRTVTTKSPHPYGFFRGDLTNVQIWNAAWSAADVTSDYNNQSVIISSISSANLLGFFKLTETLSETKLAHASAQELTNGITVGFNEVAAQPSASFIKGDFNTFGVVDGILKDNAMSFYYDYYTYGYINVNPSMTTFTNASGTNTIQASSTITTPVNWTGPYTESTPGYVTITNTGYGTKSFQTMTGDFNFSFSCNHVLQSPIYVSATDNLNYDQQTSYWPNTPRGFNFYFNNNGTFTIAEWASNGLYNNLIPNRSYVPGDTFSIARESGAIKYYHNGSLVYTSTRPIASTLICELQGNWPGISLINCSLTYAEPKVMMYAGTLADKTGCFDLKFAGIETVPASALSIKLDNVPATITLYYDYITNIPVPAPGSVALLWKAGIMVFNPADIGKTVTGNLVGIFYRV